MFAKKQYDLFKPTAAVCSQELVRTYPKRKRQQLRLIPNTITITLPSSSSPSSADREMHHNLVTSRHQKQFTSSVTTTTTTNDSLNGATSSALNVPAAKSLLVQVGTELENRNLSSELIYGFFTSFRSNLKVTTTRLYLIIIK